MRNVLSSVAVAVLCLMAAKATAECDGNLSKRHEKNGYTFLMKSKVYDESQYFVY